MKAGRELDALVAEKVMGWSLGVFDGKCNVSPNGSRWSTKNHKFEGVPFFSTNIMCAWMVFELMVNECWSVNMIEHYNGKWRVGEYDADGAFDGPCGYSEGFDNPEMAICMAAIKWKEENT